MVKYNKPTGSSRGKCPARDLTTPAPRSTIAGTMWFLAAADLVLVTHLAFVMFVVLGGFLALHWRRVALIHVPIAIYGAIIEFLGFICPLTPLENWLRQRGGQAGYSGGFIDHYVTATIYPNGLTREIQIVLGVGVLLINAAVYAVWLRRRPVATPVHAG